MARTITYDLNGNETNVVTATTTNSYQWDAVNRLVQITQLSTNNSQRTTLFTYDGLGRRVLAIEKTNGVPYVTNIYVWCGTELCEERDSTGAAVTKRFFGPGEQIGGTNYYFTFDHLGSIREMTDGSGTVHYRGDYDPYAGRWVNRDPMQEQAGLNLYAYVDNNPVNATDPLGLYQSSINTPTGLAVMAWATCQGTQGAMEFAKEAATQLGSGEFCPSKLTEAAMNGLTDNAVGNAIFAVAGGAIVKGIGAMIGAFTRPIANAIPSLAAKGGSTSVYSAIENGATKYVGISDDLIARAATHLRQKSIVINEIPGLSGLGLTVNILVGSVPSFWLPWLAWRV